MSSVNISFIAISLLAACSTNKTVELSQNEINKVIALYPNYILAALNQGKALCSENCTLCHKLRNPTSETSEKWKVIVRNMTEMANEKAVAINPKQEDLILKYLVTISTSFN